MKKLLLFAAVASLAACTNDEITEQIQTPTIAYAPAVAPLKAPAVATTENISEFVVDGFLRIDNKTTHYIDNNILTKVDGKWESTATHFWPHTGAIDFYAFSPASVRDKVDFGTDGTADQRNVVIKNFEVSTTTNSKIDLLYALTADQSHAKGSDLVAVPINFKHALSQVTFNVKNTNSAIILDVDQVEIANLASKGNYTLPKASTTLGGSTTGEWQLADKVNGGKVYSAFISTVDGITPESGTVQLTSADGGALFLLPQTTTAWDPKNDAENVAAGSYFIVRCRVWTMTAEGRVLLWPNMKDSSGNIPYHNIAIPAAFDWKEGKKYTYTLVFGDGAGYIPPTDTDGGDEIEIHGEPTLKAISYNVTVEDLNEENQEMNSVKK